MEKTLSEPASLKNRVGINALYCVIFSLFNLSLC